MTNEILTRRQRRDVLKARKSAKRKEVRHNSLLNQRKRRSAIILAMVMTNQSAPPVDTMEYLTLKMILAIWPSAEANHSKKLDKLEVAVFTTKSILKSQRRFTESRIRNSIFFAQTEINRAMHDFRYYNSPRKPLPLGFLEACIEHSLVHEDMSWREELREVH